MPRRSRSDVPGSWHHIANRAVSRRSMFENREEIRFFLSGVARAVRRGELEVHAYCVMTTHFHLLVRSPEARLSDAMQRIQGVYARHFNREHRRDGALLRARFLSRVVDSASYRATLVRYIDRNPVAAGMCRDARDYPWCSAYRFARRHPPWLSRDWVDQLYGRTGYPAVTADGAFAELEELVTARLRSDARADPFDDLVGKAPPQVREHLRRKAALADGSPGLPCVPASRVGRIVAGRSRAESWSLRFGPRTVSGWAILEAGLRRELAGQTFAAIARDLDVSGMQASRLSQKHMRLLVESDDYADRAAAIAAAALEGGPIR